nr:hypothetical protein [uncultured Acetobacterium sp.]
MPKLFQPKEKKEKKEKKKSSKSIEKNEKLKKVTEKLADNPEVVKMIQEENEESNNKKSKKSGKKLPLKIIIPAVLVILLIGGGAFFVLKSGIFFGAHAANEEDNSVDKAAIYIQADTFYSEGHYYDASALFSFLGEYEDSVEMLTKIDLNSMYPDNGTKITEYVGSDVINNYILSYKNHTEITTELENATKTTEAPASETKSESKEPSSTTTESTQPTKKTAPNTSKELVASNTSEEAAPAVEEKSTHGEEATPAAEEKNTHGEEAAPATEEKSTTTEEPEKTEEKAQEKIEYDKAVIEAVKEKTHEIVLAGNLVKSLNLPSDSPLYEAHETLKRSADYSNQAAEKILEGVEAGTYKPGGTGEVAEEVNTLFENMNKETELFHNQVSDVIALNLFELIKCPDAGELLKRYSESFIVYE